MGWGGGRDVASLAQLQQCYVLSGAWVRKLAKSTLILIPLFAVYYMGFIWLPDHISPASDLFKLYVEMLFNSFQGFLVALLFCFLNAEVCSNGQVWWGWRLKYSSLPFTVGKKIVKFCWTCKFPVTHKFIWYLPEDLVLKVVVSDAGGPGFGLRHSYQQFKNWQSRLCFLCLFC